MDKYIVKLQIDIADEKVLIYSENQDIMVEVTGDRAVMIVDGYDLMNHRKIYCEAEVDQHGLLHLGKEIEPQEW